MFGKLLALLAIVVFVPTISLGESPSADEALAARRVMARRGERSPVIVFFDDMEGGDNGWTHADLTEQPGVKFHVDSYHAYERGNSWWCGEFDTSYEGGDGYGNNWIQMLELPSIDLSGAVYPVIEFTFRCDSEDSYDLTHLEAESAGVYVSLNDGWSGVHAWNEFSGYAVGPAMYDNPLKARFRFESDVAFSDEDGGYDSDGGAFQVDDIRVYDLSDGTTLFLDDCEGGGLCTPTAPVAKGDFWHRISRPCAAYSGPSCWWCGDDSDTTLVPPDLRNSLTSPEIDIAGSLVCTLRFLVHAEVPTDDADYWTEEVTTDGGTSWYTTGVWWGDFGQCDTWATHGINGIDLDPYLPGDALQFRLTMFTTSDGCGPGVAGGSGIMLDDVWVEDWTGSAVQKTTWGSIKAMFR